MSATFIDQFLRDRTAEVLSALNDNVGRNGSFSMVDARTILQSLNRGPVELSNSQVVAIIRHLRGKGKWRGVAPNPVYIGKARARSRYRILPAGQKLIAEFKGEPVDLSAKRFKPSLKPIHRAMLMQFRERHPNGGTLGQALAAAIDASPDQKELHARRSLALFLREGYLVSLGQNENRLDLTGRLDTATRRHSRAKLEDLYIVAEGVLSSGRVQTAKPFSAPAFWLEILRSLPSDLLEGEDGFTAADLHGASWEFGDFEMPQVRSAIQDLVKGKLLEPTRRRGRYAPSTTLLQILEENSRGN